MTRRVLAAGLVVGALVGAARAEDPPKPTERALREALAAILAEPDAAARRALVLRAKDAFAAMPVADAVAAVRKGPPPPKAKPAARRVGGKVEDLVEVGTASGGYSFEHGGHVYRYAVDVPAAYDPAKPAPLLLDPGHGSWRGKTEREKLEALEMWRRFASEAGWRDALVARTDVVEQVGVDGSRGAMPEDEIAPIFDAFFRDLFARFAVDPDRVYATGLSQTGYWAWTLGTARPGRFAGIAPMSAVTHGVGREAGNLLGTAVHVIHGDADATCAVAGPRETCAVLERIGVDVAYVEVPGAGHDYAVWSRLPAGLTRFASKPKDRYPRRISKGVRNLRGPWCWWVRIDAIEKEAPGQAGTPPTAGVDAEREGQRIRLFTDGVGALTVGLSADMVDFAKPVEVVWNGKTVHQGPVVPSVATLLDLAGERCDWSATLEASVSLKK